MFFFSFYPNSIQKKMVQKLSLCGTLSKGINMYYLDIKNAQIFDYIHILKGYFM